MQKWRNVKDYEGYYQVSDNGNIKSLDRIVSNGKGTHLKTGTELSKHKNKSGYHVVTLNKTGKSKKKQVHILVCETFLNYTNEIIKHRNGKTTDNAVSNLELKPRQRKKTKYRGVYWNYRLQLWSVYVRVKNKNKFIGNFECDFQASKEFIKNIK